MGKIYCFHCNRKCKGDVLKVGEKYFHKECFTCKVCHKRMENTEFLCKDESFYCVDDYKQYCASKCFSCNEKIIGEVVTALEHTFHKECFKCSYCEKCFSPGDKVSMRMSAFLCSQCCSQPMIDKEGVTTKLYHEAPVENGYTDFELSDTQLRDSQSSTVPIQRKNNSKPLSSTEGTLSNNQVLSTVPKSKGRNVDISAEDNNLDSSTRSSTLTTPKHFHLPPGNGRSWQHNSPMVIGSKTHPLALSANNINRFLANSSQKIETEDAFNNENVKKLSSYPNGDSSLRTPIELEDWPAPPAAAVILSERNRRKIQNPTVEALSVGSAPQIRKPRSSSQYASRNDNLSESPTLNRLRLSEVINRSTSDCSTYPRMNGATGEENDIPRDPVSASRSPSAICEPLAPPRYGDHTETSPSRNDEYVRDSKRHLGYSMEYINSTNRSFLSENNAPSYRKNLMSSNMELRLDNNTSLNGLKKIRVQSNITDYTGVQRNSKTLPDQFARGTQSLNRMKTIPYEQLRVSTLKMIRNINKSNLETYLTDEEFSDLFQLTRPAFYQLPEWKRNDLKKQVDLF